MHFIANSGCVNNRLETLNLVPFLMRASLRNSWKKWYFPCLNSLIYICITFKRYLYTGEWSERLTFNNDVTYVTLSAIKERNVSDF
jgi:hypothetical protein